MWTAWVRHLKIRTLYLHTRTRPCSPTPTANAESLHELTLRPMYVRTYMYIYTMYMPANMPVLSLYAQERIQVMMSQGLTVRDALTALESKGIKTCRQMVWRFWVHYNTYMHVSVHCTSTKTWLTYEAHTGREKYNCARPIRVHLGMECQLYLQKTEHCVKYIILTVRGGGGGFGICCFFLVEMDLACIRPWECLAI